VPSVSEFWEWVAQEAARAGLSIREMERRAGLSRARINNAMLAGRKPDVAVCLGIAKVLAIRPEEAFRRAGYLPPEPEETATIKELVHLFNQLPGDDQDRAIIFVRALVEERERRKQLRTGEI